MSPVKKFLLQLLAIYLVIAVPLAVWLGPPGFSGAFLEEYQQELDHYFEVVKSDTYKRWVQRPNLVEQQPDLYTEAFQQDVAFVQGFEANADFVSEQRRRAWFEQLFRILNAGVAVVLIVHFGKQPFLNFLDKQIEEIRNRIDAAEKARNAAKSARAAAEMQMGSLAAETETMSEQAHEAAQEVVAALDAETDQLMQAIEEELELRKQLEVQHAAMLLKRQLVEEAGERIEASLKAGQSDSRQKHLVAQFLNGLEGQAQ